MAYQTIFEAKKQGTGVNKALGTGVSSISGAIQRVKTSLKQDSETKNLFDRILKK